MTTFDALFIAVLQGVTELFPISSLGHAVVLPRLFGIRIDQGSPEFLPFLVILHLGTAAALLFYFWSDWWDLLTACVGRSDPERRTESRRLTLLLVLGTLPAAALGYALNHTLRGLFASPAIAAGFLIINGFILVAGDRLSRQQRSAGVERLGKRSALLIGAAQALALLPGISRSGVTIAGGLMTGLSHEAAARFSFLLATPVIVGAGVLEVPKLLHGPALDTGGGTLGVFLLAGAVSGITAYASVAFLMRWFRQHEVRAMRPFAYYCWALGACVLGLGLAA